MNISSWILHFLRVFKTQPHIKSELKLYDFDYNCDYSEYRNWIAKECDINYTIWE
jgi:hypothetical protein